MPPNQNTMADMNESVHGIGEDLAEELLNEQQVEEEVGELQNVPAKNKCICQKCCDIVLKANCQSSGGGKKQYFTCNECNALNSRIRRLQNRRHDLKEFTQIQDKEALQIFFKTYRYIAGEDLVNGMHTLIQHVKVPLNTLATKFM